MYGIANRRLNLNEKKSPIIRLVMEVGREFACPSKGRTPKFSTRGHVMVTS